MKVNFFASSQRIWEMRKNSLTHIFQPYDDKESLAIRATTPAPLRTKENLLKPILDLGYYSGVIPYHIKYHKSRQEFIIHRNKLQRVFSIVNVLVTLLCQINHIWNVKINRGGQDPTLYFQLFRRVAFHVTFIVWFTSLWSKSNQLQTFVSSSYMALPGNYSKIAKKMVTTVCVVYGCFGIMGAVFIVDKTYWNPDTLYRVYLNRTKVTFHLNNLQPETQKFSNGFHVLLVLMQMLISFYHDWNAWILYMFMISIISVTWFQAKSLKDSVSSSNRIFPTIIFHKYATLKEVFNKSNSLFGLTLLAWVCYVVPFTSLKLNDVASDPDLFLVIYNIVYFFHVCMFLGLAADSCAKVGSMKEWIIRDDVMSHFISKKHNAILIELWNNPVALRSYNGIFTVTYGFLGNLFTLMTSFFIIITQFKMTAPCDCTGVTSCNQFSKNVPFVKENSTYP